MSGLPRFGSHFQIFNNLVIQLPQMLILGTIFRCLGPIVTVVALLSSKPLFLNPMERRDEARAYVVSQLVGVFFSYHVVSARQRFFAADSDLLTDVKAFDECVRMFSEGQTQKNIRSFCEDVRELTRDFRLFQADY